MDEEEVKVNLFQGLHLAFGLGWCGRLSLTGMMAYCARWQLGAWVEVEDLRVLFRELAQGMAACRGHASVPQFFSGDVLL